MWGARRGDFINQSTFHNVIPAAFLSGNPELLGRGERPFAPTIFLSETYRNDKKRKAIYETLHYNICFLTAPYHP